MKWVEESEALGSGAAVEAEAGIEPETCLFCGKTLGSHHSFTSHLRAHTKDLNNHVFNVVASATRPMSISDIQTLSGISVDVRNSLSRLVAQNKIRRVERGLYSANKGIAAMKKPATKQDAIAVKDSMTSSDWDSLIVAQLKKHPELYQRINNEVIAGIKKYIAFSAEA